MKIANNFLFRMYNEIYMISFSEKNFNVSIVVITIQKIHCIVIIKWQLKIPTMYLVKVLQFSWDGVLNMHILSESCYVSGFE